MYVLHSGWTRDKRNFGWNAANGGQKNFLKREVQQVILELSAENNMCGLFPLKYFSMPFLGKSVTFDISVEMTQIKVVALIKISIFCL